MDDGELRAAAELVMQGQPACGRSCRAYEKPAMAVAAAYLREHPADDGEPVTREWLESIGFVSEEHPKKSTLHREDALSVGLWSVDDGWKAMLVITDNCQSTITRGLKTRGDVRRLLAALRVERKGA